MSHYSLQAQERKSSKKPKKPTIQEKSQMNQHDSHGKKRDETERRKSRQRREKKPWLWNTPSVQCFFLAQFRILFSNFAKQIRNFEQKTYKKIKSNGASSPSLALVGFFFFPLVFYWFLLITLNSFFRWNSSNFWKTSLNNYSWTVNFTIFPNFHNFSERFTT